MRDGGLCGACWQLPPHQLASFHLKRLLSGTLRRENRLELTLARCAKRTAYAIRYCVLSVSQSGS
jgi:hypothetical protein